MNKLQMTTMLLAIGVGCGAAGFAQAMSVDEHSATEKKIDAEFKSSKESCMSLSGNAKDVCVERAKAKKSVDKAQLEAAYKPSAKKNYEVVEAKANGDYAIAKEECDEKAGNAKDVCVTEAKAAKTKALADAKAQLESAKVSSNAAADVNAARTDAAKEKNDADFAVAKEKCDTLASDAKDRCLADAKARFHK